MRRTVIIAAAALVASACVGILLGAYLHEIQLTSYQRPAAQPPASTTVSTTVTTVTVTVTPRQAAVNHDPRQVARSGDTASQHQTNAPPAVTTTETQVTTTNRPQRPPPRTRGSGKQGHHPGERCDATGRRLAVLLCLPPLRR